MSPPKHSTQPSAHWAAVLQQARIELELLSGETFTLPGAPKQAASSLTVSSSTASDEIPWSVVVKKKGKKGKKGKKKVGKRPAPDKSRSPSIHDSLEESVTWHTREVMKARTEWKHKKQRVYTYTSLPKDFQIYQDTKTLSKAEKRRIISGHRFHEQDELQRIPEDSKLSLTKPRLPRVDPIPHQRQGPVAVVPAPIPTKPGASSWSQVAGGAKPAVPKVPPPVKPSFTKVSVKPPVTKPAVPEVPVEAPITLKKKKMSQTLGRPDSEVSPVSAATPKLTKPRVDTTLNVRRQGSVPVDIQIPTKTLSWSQVAAKPPAVPEAPVKAPVKRKEKKSETLGLPATKVSPVSAVQEHDRIASRGSDGR